MEIDKGDWENGTKQLFADAQELYHQTEDVDNAKKCIQFRKEIEQKYQISQDKASELIRSYTSHVETLQEKADELANAQESTPRIEQLKQEIANSLLNIEQQKESKIESSKQVDELEEKLKQLKIEHENASKSSVVQVPLMKHSLSLYANITKIKWDFSSEEVAGSMIDSDTGKIRSFSFVKNEDDIDANFELANKIWDLIDEE